MPFACRRADGSTDTEAQDTTLPAYIAANVPCHSSCASAPGNVHTQVPAMPPDSGSDSRHGPDERAMADAAQSAARTYAPYIKDWHLAAEFPEYGVRRSKSNVFLVGYVSC